MERTPPFEIARTFKGLWFPRFICLLPNGPNLTWIERILLTEIDSLDIDPDKGCYASNAYLAGFLSGGLEKPMSAGSIANMISKLRTDGLIHDVFSDGKHRGLRSLLHRLPDGTDIEEANWRAIKAGKTRGPGTPPASPPPPPPALNDPDKSDLVRETERLMGIELDLHTQQMVDQTVDPRFTAQWFELVNLRLIGVKGSDSNYVKRQLGFWLGDHKKEVWRYEKDLDSKAAKQISSAPARTNMPTAAPVQVCPDCKDLNGMIYVGDRLKRCAHSAKAPASIPKRGANA